MKTNEKMSLWEATRTLWTKYCGIANEYKMLRDRWLYLHDRESLPALPYLKGTTFAALDELVISLSRRFNELGFRDDKIEDFRIFDSRLFRNAEDLAHWSAVFNEIKERFLDLATYEGLLKLAFFQRTVSSEISHVASGVPHSPERTIGNELFYVAADRVAQRYGECLNLGRSSWDGVITFASPKEGPGFYGAFFRSSKYLRCFHVSMSEEQKYFVGSYLVLAHEFGHAAIHANLSSSWAIANNVIGKSIIPHLTLLSEFRKDLEFPQEQFFKSIQVCEKCPNYLTPSTFGEKLPAHLGYFNEFLADLVSLQIGGLNTAEVFFDEIFRLSKVENERIKSPNLEAILRLSGILSYLNQIASKRWDKQRLEIRLKSLVKLDQEALNFLLGDTFDKKMCRMCANCVLKMGELWGSELARLNQVVQDVSGRSIFRLFVKENMFFRIDKRTEKRIVDSLLSGTPCPQEDPRYILHAYHEAYKQSGGKKRPNYAATIHSLAFNE